MSPAVHQLAVDTIGDRESGVRAGRVTPPNRLPAAFRSREISRLGRRERSVRHGPSGCRAARPWLRSQPVTTSCWMCVFQMSLVWSTTCLQAAPDLETNPSRRHGVTFRLRLRPRVDRHVL